MSRVRGNHFFRVGVGFSYFARPPQCGTVSKIAVSAVFRRITLKNPIIETWKPGVPKSLLLIVAGTVWIGTAIALDFLSFSWLSTEKLHDALFAAAAGFLFALIIHHFGFLRIVDKNVKRIQAMEGRRCVFGFIPWRSYLLIFVMVLSGILLRHSPLPKLYLAVLYTAIGTALFLSSVRYFRLSLLAVRNRSILPGCADNTPR